MSEDWAFRYVPPNRGAVRALIWVDSPSDEALLSQYAEEHEMHVSGVAHDLSTANVLAQAENGDFNLILAWRVPKLSSHPLCPLLPDLRRLGVGFMSVVEL